jgi:hypothetical protein
MMACCCRGDVVDNNDNNTYVGSQSSGCCARGRSARYCGGKESNVNVYVCVYFILILFVIRQQNDDNYGSKSVMIFLAVAISLVLLRILVCL